MYPPSAGWENARRRGVAAGEEGSDPPGDALLLGRRHTHRASFRVGFVGKDGPDKVGFETMSLLLDRGEHHLLTIAPTGAGKSRNAIIPTLLSWRGGVVVVDPKGEATRITAAYRERLDAPVWVVDPFGVTGWPTVGLDPMAGVRQAAADPAGEIGTQIAVISDGLRSSRDPFWDALGEDLLLSLGVRAALHPDPGLRGWPAVARLLRGDDVRYQLAVILDTESDLHPVARAGLCAMLGHEGEKVIPSVISTAQTRLGFVTSSGVAASLTGAGIDLDVIERGEPFTLYLVLPPDKLDTCAPFLRLLLNAVTGAMLRRAHRPELPTLLLLDETGSLGAAEYLRRNIVLLRGYGARFWLFFQDMSQMLRLWPQDWETVLNNTALQVFGVRTARASRQLGEVMGLADPLRLLTLPPDQQMLALPGNLPEIATRIDYLTDPLFRGRFSPHPLMPHVPRGLTLESADAFGASGSG